MSLSIGLAVIFLMTGGAVSAPPVFDMVEIEGVRVPHDYELADVTLRLESGDECCLGGVCPRFEFRVRGTGAIEFEGKGDSSAGGPRQDTMPERRVFQLVRSFHEKRFFQVAEKHVTLSPSLKRGRVLLYSTISGDTSYKLGFSIGEAFEKEVGVSPDSPRELHDLVEAMLKVVESRGWMQPGPESE